MPQLVRRPLSIAEEDRPEGIFRLFDVSDDGRIVYQASSIETPLFRVIDSTGRTIDRFGRTGEGPGEINSAVWLGIVGEALRIREDGRNLLVELTMNGQLTFQKAVGSYDITLAWRGDSIDHWDPLPYPGLTTGGLRVIRSEIEERSGRTLVDSTNSIFAAALPVNPEQLPAFNLPFATSDNRFWIGNGWTYQIGIFSTDGRQLNEFTHAIAPNERGPLGLKRIREQILKRPKFIRGGYGERVALPDQSARLDTLERETIPHFVRTPFHVDEQERLWVVGLSRDSTAIDVFRETTFVGRKMLPCYLSGPAPVAFSKGWLLLECEIDDSDWPTELQLYRIIEQ
jgi:hypothetical protein